MDIRNQNLPHIHRLQFLFHRPADLRQHTGKRILPFSFAARPSGSQSLFALTFLSGRICPTRRSCLSFQFFLHRSCPLSFCLTFSLSRCFAERWIAFCRRLRMETFRLFFRATPVYSLKAAVITSTSFARKNIRYLGGSTDLSFFRL